MPRTWKHPATTRLGMPDPGHQPPKSIHLVGLGPSHHDFLQMWINPETPDVCWQRDELWTVNRGIWTLPADVTFVMDHINGEAANWPTYGWRLWNHDKPIITSDNLDGWPPHVYRYPFEEIWTFYSGLPRPARTEWVINSIPFVLMYAGFIGVKDIFCWGMDYHHHRSGRVEDGHPNVAYYIRVLEEIGVNVHIGSTSTLLDTNNRAWFYGYQNDPRPQTIARRAQFRRMVGLDPAPEEEGDG